MARPGSTFQWSTSGPITTPSAGKIAAGFSPTERGAAQYLNWILNGHGQWISWLNAGILDGAWEFQGAVQHDARITALTDIYCTTGYSGAAGAQALFPNGLSSANPGKYTTGQTRQLNNMTSSDNAAATSGATHTRGLQQWIFAASSTAVYYPIPGLIPGDVITAYAVDYRKLTSAGTATSDIVYEATTGAGAGTSAETSATGTPATNSGNAPGLINLGQTGLNITVVSGRQYYVKITPPGNTTPAADRMDQVNVSWSHP